MLAVLIKKFGKILEYDIKTIFFYLLPRMPPSNFPSVCYNK